MPKTTATAPTADQLRACTSRKAAADLLPATLTRKALDAVAAELDIESLSRFRTKQALVDTIVQQAVGYRLDHDAIVNACLDRPIPADATDLRPSPVGRAAIEQALIRQMRAMTQALLDGDTTDLAAAHDLADAAHLLSQIAGKRVVDRAARGEVRS